MPTAGYVQGQFLSAKQRALLAALHGQAQVKLLVAPSGRRCCVLVAPGHETPLEVATVVSLWRRGVLVQVREGWEARQRAVWLEVVAAFREVASGE